MCWLPRCCLYAYCIPFYEYAVALLPGDLGSQHFNFLHKLLTDTFLCGEAPRGAKLDAQPPVLAPWTELTELPVRRDQLWRNRNRLRRHCCRQRSAGIPRAELFQNPLLLPRLLITAGVGQHDRAAINAD